jgi:hypothetical protein
MVDSRPAVSLRTTRPNPGAEDRKPPLTPEYQKIFEDSLADQTDGGQGNFFDHAVRCMPGGMPLMTIAFGAMEFIVTPETTYIEPGGGEPVRRIYTDGRDWPTDLDPRRLMRATLSADGSMRTATASMTY